MSDDSARGRFMAIQLTRLIGVASVLVGLMVIEQRLEWPRVVGWLLLANGLVDVFLIPVLLARKWRTPPP